MKRQIGYQIRRAVGHVVASLAKRFGTTSKFPEITYYCFLSLGACSYEREGKEVVVVVPRLVTKREFPN